MTWIFLYSWAGHHNPILDIVLFTSVSLEVWFRNHNFHSKFRKFNPYTELLYLPIVYDFKVCIIPYSKKAYVLIFKKFVLYLFHPYYINNYK